MDHKIREAIFKQKSALCLFMEDDRAFYGKYCRELTDRIIREKRILEFENPNRVKVCYEYDIVTSSSDSKLNSSDIIFLFLPDKRKSWLKIKCCGQRLTVAKSAKIKDVLFDKVRDDVAKLAKEVAYEGKDYALWEEIWLDKESIPCFVYAEPIIGLLENGGIVEIEFYDFLNEDTTKKKCWARLFDEKHYVFAYPKVSKGNYWLYVKSSSKFDVVVTHTHNEAIEPNQKNDPEVQSYTIYGSKAKDEEEFKISVKVPKTLKMWYRALVWLGSLYILSLAGIILTAIIKGMSATQFSPVYAQVGISLIAAIIATRGWMMNEETVLGRVSKWFTWIILVIVAMLIGGYSYFMLG